MTEPARNAVRVSGGAVWLLRLLDVADGIDLGRAAELAAARGARRGAAQIRGPERSAGVVLSSQPLDLSLGSVAIDALSFVASVRLFDLGVASFRFRLALEPGATASDLHRLAARLDGLSAIEATARDLWGSLRRDLAPALRSAHEPDIAEDYTVFEVEGVEGVGRGDEALESLAPGQLLLGEPERPLAESVRVRYRERTLRYYETDATAIAWNAALVVDPDGSHDELEVLEVASARLLELRYYDRLLARDLASIYAKVDAARRAFTLVRSPYGEIARRAAQLFIEMTELYDRMEGSFALVGDAYTTRLYREAEARFRLPEIAAGVREKLDTLSKVSAVLQGEISQRRTILLESAVVLLIVLEVVMGFLRTH